MTDVNPAIAGILARIEQLNQQSLKIHAEIKELECFRDKLIAYGDAPPEVPIENLSVDQDFSRMRPGQAMVFVLREAGRPLKRQQLLEVLERCGMTLGKKSHAKKLGNLLAAVRQDPARRMVYDEATDTISLKKR